MKSLKTPEKPKYDTMAREVAPRGDGTRKMQSSADVMNTHPQTAGGMAREACLEALAEVEKATQKCIYAGHLLIEWKNGFDWGDFLPMVAKTIPEISLRTAQRWMEGARNVAKALPAVPELDIDVTVSQILASPSDELPEAAREWKQMWLTFTEGKTLKDCIESVFVGGEEVDGLVRAINGKTKGGAGGDRKDFSLFTARKLGHVCAHLGHWDGMTESQRSEIKLVVAAAISGGEQALRRDGKGQWVRFGEGWPKEVCQVALEAIKARLKGVK